MRLTVENEKYIYTLDTSKNMIIQCVNGPLEEQVSATAVYGDMGSILMSKCGKFINLKQKYSTKRGAIYQLDKKSGAPIIVTVEYAEKIMEKFE